MQIRDAEVRDIPAILAIYNDAVINTTAIWNEKIADEASRIAWLEDRRRASYPVIVAEEPTDGVLGYASFGDWRAWDGYRHTVEHSVYVSKDARGAGIGAGLMVDLIARARAMGKHVMIAGIESENEPSIRLHLKLGFTHAGCLREVGTKFGRWLDLTFLQLSLDVRSAPDGLDLENSVSALR